MPYRDAHELAKENEELRRVIEDLRQERSQLLYRMQKLEEQGSNVGQLCRDLMAEMKKSEKQAWKMGLLLWAAGSLLFAHTFVTLF